MEKRKPYQGVLNILSFNRHFYVFGILALGIFVLSQFYLHYSPVFFWVVILSFTYGLMAPLIVSAYVYDFSGYYEFNWLQKVFQPGEYPKHLININAGFDETSFILEEKFPQSKIEVFDFYNVKRHTESAIIRARKVSKIFPNTLSIESKHIPLPTNSVDAVFLLSAAHEIRSNEEKIQFLKECNRVCKQDGKVVMVEHLRDLPNFLAFTVGFTHFFSKKIWKNAFHAAGFSSFEEIKFTPFMSIFISQSATNDLKAIETL